MKQKLKCSVFWNRLKRYRCLNVIHSRNSMLLNNLRTLDNPFRRIWTVVFNRVPRNKMVRRFHEMYILLKCCVVQCSWLLFWITKIMIQSYQLFKCSMWNSVPQFPYVLSGWGLVVLFLRRTSILCVYSFQISKCFCSENPLLLTKWNTQVYDVMCSLSLIFSLLCTPIFCCFICFGLNWGFVVVSVESWAFNFLAMRQTQNEKTNLLQNGAFYRLTSICVADEIFRRRCKMCEYNDPHNTYMLFLVCNVHSHVLKRYFFFLCSCVERKPTEASIFKIR